jgi:hypothetical protein
MDFANNPMLDLGYNQPSMQEFVQLQKALEAGWPAPSYTGGGAGWPLLPQSIQMTLAWATAQMEHVRLWKAFPKELGRIGSTIHEYSRQAGLGSNLDFAMAEGDVGPIVDSEFERLFAKVRFMSHIRSVSNPMTLLKPLVGANDAIEKANYDAAIWQAVTLENALFFGDDNIHPYSVNGLRRACEDVNHVADMRGLPLDTDKVYDYIVSLVEPPNYGLPTHLWTSVGVKADFGKIGGTHVRFNVPPGLAAKGDFKLGIEATGIIGPMGDVPFEPDVFLSPKQAANTVAIGQNIPNTPAWEAQGAPADAGSDVASQFTADDAGNYIYKVVACGPKGKSAPLTSSPTAVASGHKISMTIAAPAGTTVHYYTIYRTKKGGAASANFEIARVKQATSNGSAIATTFVDKNENLPDTSWAFLVEMKPEVMVWKQLLDFARIPLAMTELRQPFAYVLYGMPIIEVPTKLYAFKNIGRVTA